MRSPHPEFALIHRLHYSSEIIYPWSGARGLQRFAFLEIIMRRHEKVHSIIGTYMTIVLDKFEHP